MKKFTSLLLAFAFVILLFPEKEVFSAKAITYQLTVAGVEVTDKNCADILGDGVLS